MKKHDMTRDENAKLTDRQIAMILHYKHGWRLTRQRVWQCRQRAEAKLRRALEGLCG